MRTLSTCPRDFLNPKLKAFFNIFLIFDILQQKLSMIAFSYACNLAPRFRYTVEEHFGEILAFW